MITTTVLKFSKYIKQIPHKCVYKIPKGIKSKTDTGLELCTNRLLAYPSTDWATRKLINYK